MDPLSAVVGAGAISALAGFCGFIVRDYIADLKHGRDEAVAGWREQTVTNGKLVAALEHRNELDRKRLGEA